MEASNLDLRFHLNRWISDLNDLETPSTCPSRNLNGNNETLESSFAGSRSSEAGNIHMKDPIRVRLATIRSPAEFWAMPLPTPGKTLDLQGPLGKVLKAEAKLDCLFGKERTAKGSISVEDIKKGMLVAARLFPRFHWHRARVVEIIYKPGMVKVRVFLIDYGNYSDEIPIKDGIRKLPDKMKLYPRPLAFVVVLQGLRPLSWELKFDQNNRTFDQIDATRWSESAMKIVLDIWRATPHRMATITHYRYDERKRCHGVVEFNGFRQKVVLNQILVDSKHARHSAESFILDTEDKCGVVQMPRNLSICGSGTEIGTISLDESVDFVCDNNDMENILPAASSHVSFATNTSESGSRCGDKLDLTPLEFLDSKTGKKPNKYNKMSKSLVEKLQKTLSSDQSFISDETLNQSFMIGGARAVSETSTKKLTSKEMLERLKVKRREKSNSEKSEIDESIWSSFYESEEEIDAEEEAELSVIEDEELKRRRRLEFRNRKALMKNSKIQMLPAGVDTGRFLEEQLKRVVDHVGIGPKQVVNLLE